MAASAHRGVVPLMPAHDALRDVDNWLLGGLGAIASVLAAIAFDPTGAVAAVVLTFIQQAGTLFTVLSIGGFTVAPNVSWLASWAPLLQNAAILTGIIFGLTLVDKVWDNFKERVL